MQSALIGFGSFFVVVTAIGLVGYYYADPLENWAKEHFGKRRDRHS